MRPLARDAARGAALVALAVVPHLSSLAGGWLIDDEAYVVDNPLLVDAHGLASIWSRPSALPQYYPLVFTSFWLERRLFGLDPRAFHATNLLLHAAVAVLAWRVLLRARAPAPWLAAALFAVHPLHVDTVAWVAERKNLLSALFALLAAGLYLEFDRRRSEGERGGRWRYAGALIAFALALLAKTAVVGLPVALALVVGWRRGRFAARDLAPLLPLAAVGLALAAVTVGLEGRLVAAGDLLPEPNLWERPWLVARAALFYLGKIAWPARLSFDYGTWPTAVGEPANLAAGLGLVAGVVLLWAGRRRWGWGPLVAVASFVALAAPALGLISFYFHRYSFVADHFVYLPSLPVLALYAGAAARLCADTKRTGAGVACLALAMLAGATWRHGRDYRNHESLARAVLRVNPASWLAHNHLGNELLRQGRFAAAIAELEEAERVAPGRPETQINLALALMNAGDLAGAEAAARRAIGIRDGASLAHRVLGDALLRAGRPFEAAEAYRAALARDPASGRARVGLGLAQSQAGHDDEAVATLDEVLRVEPRNVTALTARAYSLARLGRRRDAVADLERALALAPGDPRLARNLALLGAAPEPPRP